MSRSRLHQNVPAWICRLPPEARELLTGALAAGHTSIARLESLKRTFQRIAILLERARRLPPDLDLLREPTIVQ